MAVCVFGREISALDRYVLKALNILIGLNASGRSDWGDDKWCVCAEECVCECTNLAVCSLAAWFSVRSLSQANYCIPAPPVSGLSGPTERRASLPVIKLGRVQAELEFCFWLLKKKKKKNTASEFHLKFHSIRLFSLNVSTSSCTFFFSSVRMICLRAIIYYQDVLDSSKDLVLLFFFRQKYRVPVLYWFNYTGCSHQVGWLSSSGAIKKQHFIIF